MEAQSVWDGMIDAGFPMKGFDVPGVSTAGDVLRIGMNGMETRQESIPSGRFAWLEFELPLNGYRVKALGEVTSVVGGDGPTTVTYRFKHVFPRDRVAMNDFLTEEAVA